MRGIVRCGVVVVDVFRVVVFVIRLLLRLEVLLLLLLEGMSSCRSVYVGGTS